MGRWARFQVFSRPDHSVSGSDEVGPAFEHCEQIEQPNQKDKPKIKRLSAYGFKGSASAGTPVQRVQNVRNTSLDAVLPAPGLARKEDKEEDVASESLSDFLHAWREGHARLDPQQPPGDVPVRQWGQFVDDVGRFLESDFAPVVAMLGWGALDLFGADRGRPFARIDQAGLLWLLNGDRLIALSENTATIETRTGARHTWRRKKNEFNRALAWELD
jgi:hypothetical protein